MTFHFASKQQIKSDNFLCVFRIDNRLTISHWIGLLFLTIFNSYQRKNGKNFHEKVMENKNTHFLYGLLN